MRATTTALLLSALLGCDRGAPRAESTPSATPVSAATTGASASPRAVPVREHEVLAPVFHVDRLYPSMKGPQETLEVRLVETNKPELLWIVGFEAVMVETDGTTPASQEWMCHSNLDLEPTLHGRLFGGTKRLSGRLFTLSQGQSRIDLPPGTGLPVWSGEALSLNAQVLNLNHPKASVDVRHRVTIRYVRDADLAEPLRPLFPAAAYGLKLLRGKDGVFGGESRAQDGADHAHGGSCLPGRNAGMNEFDDGKGRAFTGHWVVAPGHEENRTRVTEIMNLPFDTTLHYVAVHLHPFAERLELVDTTTGTSIFRATTRQAAKGIGLDHVDHYTSPTGVPLAKGHEFELVSVYENTSGNEQDSMAVMNLYLHDVEFTRPDARAAAAVLEADRPTVERPAGAM
ncbi:MAG: hypothetical protein FJ096_04545 [Deltaproteobacteria bacterium]|nr:hypothetical protein [Deltaproteobacteria bacterium]